MVGGCDIYTTKAARDDRKLYKSIDRALQSKHEADLKYSASLSGEQATAVAPSLNLSRDSPFGSLSQVSSRRTFAYFIATLNATHEDYDFSFAMKPTDFKREKSLRAVMNMLDSTLYNLRPRSIREPGPSRWSCSVSPTGPPEVGGGEKWSAQMWQIIDEEMVLHECSVYRCDPEDDLFDSEEGALWEYHYFFFNKAKKRVCYFWLRGFSMMSYSPAPIIYVPAKHKRHGSDWSVGYDAGSSKRAKYWLGENPGIEREWGEDYYEAEGAQFVEVEDDEPTIVREDEEDEVEVEVGKDAVGGTVDGGEIKEGEAKGNGAEADEEESELSPTPASEKSRSKSPVRGHSEDAVETMEI